MAKRKSDADIIFLLIGIVSAIVFGICSLISSFFSSVNKNSKTPTITKPVPIIETPTITKPVPIIETPTIEKCLNILKSYKSLGHFEQNSDKETFDFYNEILKKSEYPKFINRTWELFHNKENDILIIDYTLPNKNVIPTLKEIKYSKRSGAKKIFHTEKYISSVYDDMCYQICLRTLSEIIQSDNISNLKGVVFNGYSNYINLATGNDTRSCIMSVHVDPTEFKKINLYNVEPKICFKSLKGICNPKLHELTPVAPIISFNKEDKRFVNSENISDSLNQETNIAAIGWEEFEHLIREIFEKEFSSDGGEVKVTQSSRDGGVDAVVFDPDPIKGGKIVIQAKRYTNTVDVSCVRDLYGTLMNEGANKGILVTTSSFGSDSYKFAKDKPLTLIDGNNLLFLLNKHGKNVKIDLEEAKKMGNSMSRKTLVKDNRKKKQEDEC